MNSVALQKTTYCKALLRYTPLSKQGGSGRSSSIEMGPKRPGVMASWAMAMVLPWDVTEMHKRRVKQVAKDSGTENWQLVENAERQIRMRWVLDIGTEHHDVQTRTFTMCAARNY